MLGTRKGRIKFIVVNNLCLYIKNTFKTNVRPGLLNYCNILGHLKLVRGLTKYYTQNIVIDKNRQTTRDGQTVYLTSEVN